MKMIAERYLQRAAQRHPTLYRVFDRILSILKWISITIICVTSIGLPLATRGCDNYRLNESERCYNTGLSTKNECADFFSVSPL